MGRRFRLIVLSLAALALPAAAPAPTPLSPPLFGAISYSAATRLHGLARDFGNERDAVVRALSACETHARSGDCRILVTFRNACGALAESPDGAYGTGWGVDTARASTYAGEVCADGGGTACRVTQVICTGARNR